MRNAISICDRTVHAYYKREFPLHYHALMDTRRWGPGERLVFEPYTQEAFDQSRDWIAGHGIFAEGTMGECEYDRAVVSLNA